MDLVGNYFFLCILMVVTAILSPMSFAEDSAPSAAIPCLEKPVTLDGVWRAEEWSDAAVIRKIQDMGNAKNSEPRTDFYVKYDSEALYVAAVCHETEKGYPQAFKRGSRDMLISNDDAVQVVLGVADENIAIREVLTMGGYQGALGGATTSADHYYQFTVNAVGSLTRTYNETPLKQPLFTAAAGKMKDAWVVEMQIPFASCGLKVRDGQTIYANLFRFRPPVMTAWHLPAFGGYAAMPLGTFTLLSKDAANKRTVETLPQVSAVKAEAKKPHWTGEIGYYPLSGAIAATIHQDVFVKGTQARFNIDGLGEKKIMLNEDEKQLMLFDIPKGSQPARQAHLTVVDTQGKILVDVKRDLPAVTAPEWVDTKAGIAYVDQKIPRPWTKPVVKEKSVQLVNKTLTFNSLGLLNSVKDSMGELLAGDVQIVVQKNDQPMDFKPVGVSVESQGLGAEISGKAQLGNATLETRSFVDYDGFTVVKVRVKGITPSEISKLSIRIPLKSENARFFHKVLVQEIGELTGHGYETSAGPLWTGNYDKGLAFSFDTNPFLSRNLRKQMRIVETNDVTWMEFNFVDQAGELTDDGHIFRFFLQPTPTKPTTLEKVHPRVQWQWEGWSDYQGYPDLVKIDKLKAWSDDLHQKGQIGLLYTCQGLAENAPGFTTFREDLEGVPGWVFYRRAFNPGLNIPCYFCCKRGAEGDLQLWAFEKLVKEAGIDGTVSDGLSLAWDCNNPGHADGCGRQTPVQWDQEPLTRVTGQRQFLKRIRGIFNESGRPFYMAAHCGGGLDINTLSFFDGYMEGEQLARFRTGYQIPVSTIAVGYSGRPWGFRTIFWEKTWRRTRGFSWSLTYAMLHDLELEDSAQANEIYVDFQNDKETTYYPYWRQGTNVALSSDHSKVSYYLKKDSALVVVGNLEFEPDDVSLDLTKLFPGQAINVRELLSGQPMKVENGLLKSSLAGYHCLVLRVNTGTDDVKESANVSLSKVENFSIKTFEKKDWLINADAPGVSAEYPAEGGMALKSTAYQAPAIAELKDHAIGQNGTIVLKVNMTGRFRLNIGPVTLLHDYDWQMPGPLNGWNEGTIYQIPIPTGKVSTLAVSIKDGVFDAVLDGKLLIKNMRYDLAANGNKISVQTWAGDSVMIDVVEISTTPKPLIEKGVIHPVL
jgi:hypothetical protein